MLESGVYNKWHDIAIYGYNSTNYRSIYLASYRRATKESFRGIFWIHVLGDILALVLVIGEKRKFFTNICISCFSKLYRECLMLIKKQ